MGKAELVEHILWLQERAYRAFRPMAHAEWLNLDLTMPQLKVLLLLFMDGASRMGHIASSLHITLATATGIVDRLVERGLVLRETPPQDRRVVRCQLLPEGQLLVGSLWEAGQARARSFLNRMTPAELKLVAQALEALLRAAESWEYHAPASDNLGEQEGER